MLELHQVIVRPLLSEKGVWLARTKRAYPFAVALEANKIQIREAVERLYKVKVDKVRTIRVSGKSRTWRFRRPGRTSSWKKAYVTLAEGQSIDIV